MLATDSAAQRRGLHGVLRSRTALLLAFAFAVMADPVSSIAYALERAQNTASGALNQEGVTAGGRHAPA